jgi:CDAN1-interacting nuclease 1
MNPHHSTVRSIIDSSVDSPSLLAMSPARGISPRCPRRSITLDTLISIHMNEYQDWMRRRLPEIRQPASLRALYARFRAEVAAQVGPDELPRESVLVRLAEDVNVSPYLLARLMVQQHLYYANRDRDDRLHTAVEHALADLSSIDDPRLRWEVQQCIRLDDCYAPSVALVRRHVGEEHEFMLHQRLHNLGIAFLDESELRRRGFPKTPDVKLEVPIAVQGVVIHWIDSKATFGNDYTHSVALEQYRSYCNRFGSGMVIYWMGFIDDLAPSCLAEGILLVDDLPVWIEALARR